MGQDPPSNASIDSLFAGARTARIEAGPGFPGGVLLEIDAGELSELRSTLEIVESDERFHCMCLGDLIIDLRGRLLSAGRVSFHHGLSVRVDSWCSDARLVDGPALLRFLAERGVGDPLRDYERAQEERRIAGSAREAWVAAAPDVLRDDLGRLEGDAMGMPRTPKPAELDEVLGRLGTGEDPEAVARTLLSWLAVGRGPWSGFPSYEELPIRLLERLPIKSVVAVAMDPGIDDALVCAAARFFGDHQMVTYRKSVLAKVPDAFFERARPLLKVDDDRMRHDHAAQTARAVRRPRGGPREVEGGLLVLGESTDGPLSGLAADGDTLVSADVSTIVRFETDSVAARPVADAHDHFVVLSSTMPIAWATIRRGEIATPGGPLAQGEPKPVEVASSAAGVAWISSEDGGGRAIRAVLGGETEPRTLATVELAWSLAMDGEHVFFVEDGWAGSGTLRRVSVADGAISKLASLPRLGHSMGTPRLVVEGGHVLVAVGDRVLEVDPAGGTRPLVEAPQPVRALAADAAHLVAILGSDEDRKPWSFVVAPRSGGPARRVAKFRRAPYHRHPLAIARGLACTVVGDQVIGARLAR